MPFRIEDPGQIRKSIPRLVRRQIESVVAAVQEDAKPKGDLVHDVRTTIKKVRAVLLLVGGKRERFRSLDRRLRDVARSLAPVRDAAVLPRTFERLQNEPDPNGNGKTLPGEAKKIRAALSARSQQITKEAAIDESLAAAARELAQMGSQAERIRPRKKGFRGIAVGLSATYRRARQQMKIAFAGGHARDFHAWRKDVKAHALHCRLLAEVIPAVKARSDSLDELGDLLGLDQDVAVLIACAHETPALFGSAPYRQSLRRRGRSLQRELRVAAQPLGLSLFAAKTSAFCSEIAVALDA